MGIIVDLIIISLSGLSIYEGYKKGLTKSFLKIFTFVLAIIISIFLFKPVANFVINQTEFDENLQNTIIEKFNEEAANNNEKANDNKSDEENMPTIFYEYIQKKIKQVADESKELIIQTASRELAISIIDIIIFIILLIATRIILIFVKVIANIITKIPVIKQCDELGGGIYGALRATIIILIIFTIISIISPLISENEILLAVNQSIIGKFIYQNNFIIKIIM